MAHLFVYLLMSKFLVEEVKRVHYKLGVQTRLIASVQGLGVMNYKIIQLLIQTHHS